MLRSAASKAPVAKVQGGDNMSKTVYYASVGPVLTLYDLDVDGAGADQAQRGHAAGQYSICLAASVAAFLLCRLEQRRTGHCRRQAFRQCACHRSGDRRAEAAWRAGGAAVAPDPRQRRCQRPISADRLQHAEQHHRSSPQCRRHDRRAGGAARTSSTPASTRIRSAHAPSNRTAILVTRGNNAGDGKPEDPGAIKTFRFEDGVLTNLASIAPGNGLASGRGISTFIRPSRGPSSRSSGRTSSMSTSSMATTGLSRDAALRQRDAVRSARRPCRKAPARSMFIPTANSSI